MALDLRISDLQFRKDLHIMSCYETFLSGSDVKFRDLDHCPDRFPVARRPYFNVIVQNNVRIPITICTVPRRNHEQSVGVRGFNSLCFVWMCRDWLGPCHWQQISHSFCQVIILFSSCCRGDELCKTLNTFSGPKSGDPLIHATQAQPNTSGHGAKVHPRMQLFLAGCGQR